MICTLTARKMKPGKAQEFANEMDSLIASMPAELRERWRHIYICRDVEDDDTLLSFGFFEGTLEELREVQATGEREARVGSLDHLIESVELDGSYEVIAEAQSHSDQPVDAQV